MEEIFDIYTHEGLYLGTKEKSICHSEKPGFYHKPVWIWIVNSKNDILVQKRSHHKKIHPNELDMSSAGHVVAGETSIQGAIGETYEELGIKTTESDYKFICEYISDKPSEVAQLYLLKLDIDISDLVLQEEKISKVKWLTYENFKKLFYPKEFIPFDDEYRKLVLEILKENFN